MLNDVDVPYVRVLLGTEHFGHRHRYGAPGTATWSFPDMVMRNSFGGLRPSWHRAPSPTFETKEGLGKVGF